MIEAVVKNTMWISGRSFCLQKCFLAMVALLWDCLIQIFTIIMRFHSMFNYNQELFAQRFLGPPGVPGQRICYESASM